MPRICHDQNMLYLEGRAGGGLWQRRWVRLGLIWGVWTIIGLVFTIQFYFAAFRSERPIEFFRALYVQMSWSYVWALATPLILWLARRFPIERNKWPRNLLIHLLTSTLLVFVAVGLAHLLIYINYGWRAGRPYSILDSLRFILNNFSEGVGIYLLVSLISYAFTYYNRSRQGELRATQLEAQLSQAQLQALKMQLHP
ncbi:MAG TPA: hypothetical protein VD966_04670, partial [Pyrinomonadaceae bacterium]|nr:hypothetical protein [Pyrinomonadaceae bacterium]